MKRIPKISWVLSLLCFSLSGFAAGNPERVLIIGDSMMHVTAHALTLALDKEDGVTTKSQTSIGTGLARLDAFDWMSKADELIKEVNPDMTIVWFGTNDRQPMQTDTRIVKVEDPEWEMEYSRRIGVLMDKLTAAEGAEVLWLELPVMKDPKVTAEVDLINKLAKAEADKRDTVTFYETRKLLGRKVDKYSPNVIGPTGRMIVLRSSDGIHLSRPGADRIADAIRKDLY